LQEELEGQMARLMGRMLREQRRRVFALLEQDKLRVGDAFWGEEVALFQHELSRFLTGMFIKAEDDSSRVRPQKKALPDILAIAADFAMGLALDLARGLTDTARRAVSDVVLRFATIGGYTIGDAEDDLIDMGIFDANRAAMIARTEITRTYALAEERVQDEYAAAGIEVQLFWNTVGEDACPICEPLDGTFEGEGEFLDGLRPPLHPNCRCWLTLAVPE
jgi:SPP1 gp7 family putative phage head morphogenesis protein